MKSASLESRLPLALKPTESPERLRWCPVRSRGILDLMSVLRSFSRVLALGALLGLFVPGVVSAAEGPTDFNGVWLFNQERSDDLRAVVDDAVGPDATQGDIKNDIVRIWIRQWLLERPRGSRVGVPDRRADRQGLQDRPGDEVAIYYFGREAASRGPLGGTLKATVKWQGEQLLLEKKSEDGGRIAALYTLMPGGKNLIVAYLLEHKTLKKPLEARMIFDRDEDTE